MCGPTLVLPSIPFHENTYAMLMFQSYSALFLMNGYSGHSTWLFDSIMQAERVDGAGRLQQLSIAADSGCRYVILLKDRLSSLEKEQVEESRLERLYENARFAVYQFADSHRF